MNSKQLYSNLEMLMIAFGVASFTLGHTYFLLFIAFYSILKNYQAKFSSNFVIFFFTILASGTFFALLAILFKEYDEVYSIGILLRIRFFWIRIFFAFGILLYINKLTYKQILKFVYFISIIHLLVGAFQLVNNPTGRVIMLTAESSAAGLYYIFMLPLLIEYYKHNKKARVWIVLYLVVGIFIRSKAQILALPFFLLYFVFKSDNKVLRRVVLYFIVIGIVISPLLLKVREIDIIINFFETLHHQGIGGLTEKNKIWSTFTLRFSSFLTAIQLFFENLLGSGFGVFHPEYISRMNSPESVQSQMTGVEITRTLKNDLYATPKSIFFEYLVSSGLFFLLPLLGVLWTFHKKENSTLIKASLYGLVLVSLMVELSPFITLVVIIVTIFYKKNKEYTTEV